MSTKTISERAARLARRIPPERLDQLMRSPARRAVLRAVFWQMPRQLDRKRAGNTKASVRWEITHGDQSEPSVFQLELDNGHARVSRVTHNGLQDGEPPNVTITLGGGLFLRLATGAEDPMRAYFSGRITIAGDIMLAAKLGSLFVVPGD